MDPRNRTTTKDSLPRTLKALFFQARILPALAAALFMMTALPAWTAEYFVLETAAENGVSPQDARVATTLVKNSVTARGGEVLVQDEALADYVLQPRLIRLGDSYILTIEKSRAGEIIFATQAKLDRIDDLDQAAKRATRAAILEPEYGRRGIASETRPSAPYGEVTSSGEAASSADTSRTNVIVNEDGTVRASRSDILPNRKLGYISLGLGPVAGRHMNTDNALYGLMAGYTWDINPQVSIKLLGEGTFSTGDENGRFFNLGVGALFFLPTDTIDNAPFVGADLGYGWAEASDSNRDTNGACAGVSVGYQFFRTTQTTLDVLLRYAAILNNIDGDGNPQIIGLRVAVNF